MIIWLNGAFGAGKSTLAEELHDRIPDAVIYDPEDVGLMLWRWLKPNDDFQDLASWRDLVIATAVSLRRHHADTLIVPMSLLNDAYRAEILGGLRLAGEDVLHVFLEADLSVLRERLETRASVDHLGGSEAALNWAMARVTAWSDAGSEQSGETLILRSDELTPAELADEVLAAVGRRRIG